MSDTVVKATRCLTPLLLLVAACGGGSGSTGPSSSGSSTVTAPAGTLVFRVSPIDQAAIRWITPLGNLNPPDHTQPTDHIYFYFAAPDAGESPVARRATFFAPADGIVETLLGGAQLESKIFIRATSTLQYYLDHIIPDTTLARGAAVTAGQRLGTTGSAYAVDLGVINQAVTLAFVNPARYISDTLHADAPLKYFEEPLRSQLYARVQRLGSDLDGRIDYDVAGRLAGNWFGELVPAAQLAFAYDTYDPSQVRIAFANAFVTGGVFAIAAGSPAPRDVSAANGLVRYTQTRATTGLPVGGTPSNTLLVQVLNDQRIQVELLPFPSAADAFTSAARIFIR